MLIQASDLERFSLSAVDGPIGRIHDLQVDDQGWVVSDIVASVGHWLTERLIIVRPTSVVKVDRSHQSIEVALTPDQIADAAGPMSRPSVSRQHQVAAYHYLGLPLMVADLEAADPGLGVALLEEEYGRERLDPHLRSLRALVHYWLEVDGMAAGHVADWIVDLADWRVAYAVVRVPAESGRRHVLVPVEWLGPISWSARAVYVGLPRDVIVEAPDYRPGRIPDLDYRTRLSGWYEEPLAHDRRRLARATRSHVAPRPD